MNQSGLPRIRLHDLRHTHATLLLKARVPIKVVSERLGHSTPGFTMATYQHVLPGMQAEAAKTFAALLERPASALSEWRGVRAITHPSGYTPDEAAGQGAVHMHCIGHALAQYLRSGHLVPRNSSLGSPSGLAARRSTCFGLKRGALPQLSALDRLDCTEEIRQEDQPSPRSIKLGGWHPN